jgi:excisionase family DNA binding protein
VKVQFPPSRRLVVGGGENRLSHGTGEVASNAARPSGTAAPSRVASQPQADLDVHADRLLVTPEEAARRLSTSRSTVYEKLRSGELFSVKDGRRRLISGA